MAEPSGLLTDLALFLLTRGWQRGGVALRQIQRRWALRRDVTLVRDLPATVRSAARLRAPLSGAEVCACRLVVEQQLDHGEWVILFDETQHVRLELDLEHDLLLLESGVRLIVPPSSVHSGEAIRRVVSLPADADDIRGTEYLLMPGQSIQLLGLRRQATRTPTLGPYRGSSAPPRWTGRPLISAWSSRELLRLVRQHPERLPPDLRGARCLADVSSGSLAHEE